MKNETWDNFIQKTQNRKPISYVADAVKLINTKGLKKALDLGCGAGIDAKYLAENDFYVDAVDFSDASIEQTKKICASSKVSVIKSDINEFNIITSSYVLIIAWNSLPFLTKKNTRNVLLKIQDGLSNQGIFVFSIFGIEDEWAKTKPEMSFWSIEEFKNVLYKMKFLKLLEEKGEGTLAVGGSKYWHKIQGIAIREN
ncbi:hypothetical protein A3B05_00630 [Candidatus Giovannonibacteria bacterium RIFCSPLOWO2_01_FULL_43_160]|uniref:Methyltransferase type 12 n=3 Tax=Parcubacteria group TaxID=1794811 RepID=A0A0G0HU32_9BACT|nr:MAG: Methyltransferase type 12 [Candidatus Yanofskybacteria bacterium GW2011_GWC2_37_9]KKS95369.1 MAG: Methyltransferase type 12 [Candidatus Giovannonibacteria bacterium GW2011_GWB1_43_13]KKS99088.1 MAG: Methyltransferase type 12 [Candidatus Giovannonibacteria bacterium GW2011_GWA1_43_15]KKT62777.1 MAG: Methyltransferase type 12 [Candidatus Giovannonibacteria bacterium GW2011_GWA2_44_26]OGF59054.1 MAG: hypothetical protein A2652_02970 [Candidatus Giovannonibacteria bacterium RIFCSPHIGHO2_01_